MSTMSVQLNHTIVWCRDNEKSARFLAEMLGLSAPVAWGPFQEVDVANDVALAFHSTSDAIVSQHYAFLVSDDDFDAIFGRIRAQGLDYWADPGCTRAGEINHNDGGRGVYFPDPDGHLLEVITRPYGSG
jgi:catechol 2,3-dioxygenase-like lactoylglutathione lyase family enzyme